MKEATPSFSNLFRRSHYFRPSIPWESDEEAFPEEFKKERREIERFVVACIGFCLKHDTDFRNLFWTEVMGVRDGTTFPKEAGIEVEPEDWADLRVEWDTGGKHFVHIVECKVAAKLDDKQHPSKPHFTKVGGYGRFLVDYPRGTASDVLRYYTVLGVRTKLDLPDAHKKFPISLRQVVWEALAFDPAVSELHNDLISSFSNLAIPAFRMTKAKTITIKSGPGMSDIYAAQNVIDAVIVSLNLVPKYCTKIIEGDDSGAWNYGAWPTEVKSKKPEANFHRSLWKRLSLSRGTSKHWAAFWFGYAGDKKSIERKVKIVSAFMQPDETGRNIAIKLKNRIERLFPGSSGKIEWDTDAWVFDVKGTTAPIRSDVEWFTSVISAACKK